MASGGNAGMVNTNTLETVAPSDHLTRRQESTSHIHQTCVPMTHADNQAIAACRGSVSDSTMAQFGGVHLTDHTKTTTTTAEVKGERRLPNGHHFGNDTQFTRKASSTTNDSTRSEFKEEPNAKQLDHELPKDLQKQLQRHGEANSTAWLPAGKGKDMKVDYDEHGNPTKAEMILSKDYNSGDGEGHTGHTTTASAEYDIKTGMRKDETVNEQTTYKGGPNADTTWKTILNPADPRN
jgi:hypothetical protein